MVPGDLVPLHLTGCLPQRSRPLPLAFAIQDGASYAGAILKAELTDADITWAVRCCAERWQTIRVPSWQVHNLRRCTICCVLC